MTTSSLTLNNSRPIITKHKAKCVRLWMFWGPIWIKIFLNPGLQKGYAQTALSLSLLWQARLTVHANIVHGWDADATIKYCNLSRPPLHCSLWCLWHWRASCRDSQRKVPKPYWVGGWKWLWIVFKCQCWGPSQKLWWKLWYQYFFFEPNAHAGTDFYFVNQKEYSEC